MYHAHASSHRGDGIFGPVVVRQRKDIDKHLYEFDLKEHVMVLTDWYAYREK